MADCPSCNPLPSYHDDAELERRRRLMEAKSRNPDSIDKPAVLKQNKPVRFRTMHVKKTRSRRRFNPKRPEFL